MTDDIMNDPRCIRGPSQSGVLTVGVTHVVCSCPAESRKATVRNTNQMELLCEKLQSACPLLPLPLRGDLQQ